VYKLGFFLENLYSVGSEWDTTDLIGGAEERAAFKLVTGAWFRKRGEKSF
jgi:hypothetical protein